MQAEFCHIAPTPHLNLVEGRPIHLVLAHLIEEDSAYVDFYLEQKEKYNCKIIMDNSAFEMYKQGRDMYPSERLLQMGTAIKADWIVMSDYPNEPSEKTIEAAKKLAPEFHDAGFGTFFVPQSRIGDVRDCTDAFMWAANNPKIIDYVGVSILTAPNCYGVERGNKLQRFVSRLRLMYEMDQTNIFRSFKKNGQRVHFLGMVDGPNEIMYMSPWKGLINTWDSSAAVWAGLNGIKFDLTPTGMVDGKFEEEVDFNFKTDDNEKITLVKENMDYIDRLVYGYLYDGSDLRPWEKKR